MEQPPRARRPGRPANPLTPERVVATALALLDELGLPALTLGAVARALGCHVTSLYTHVASVDDLRRRLAFASLDDLAAELEHAVADRDRDDAVAAIAGVHCAYARRHPGRMQLLHGVDERADPELAAAGRRAAAPVRAALRSYGLDDAQVRTAHVIFSAMTRGFVQSEAAGVMHARDADRAFGELVALVVLGLRSGRWPLSGTPG
jgi:AcrR family transcriptional regulator